jgi:hypothetical protein
MRSWLRLAYPWQRDSSFINAGLSKQLPKDDKIG